ncbi:hypothetical protein QOZ80_1BG0056700 [Eleusine coracana subsp. coracana]|nr:hypothetical protein QOZ80_1BG0056700 [Eleusine coracana subsp. coracana]
MGAPEQEEGECGAFVKRRKGAAATDVSMELDFLDCPVCFHPLRPPIYQCAVGHVVCSSCRAKLPDKCHCCSLATGYNRCHIIEHVVDSTKVPCCYDNFGCTEKITYYEKESHEKVCPHAPCFCPESGCDFTGSIPMLLSHFSVVHKWHLARISYNKTFRIRIAQGSTALQGEDGQLFLVNMEGASVGFESPFPLTIFIEREVEAMNAIMKNGEAPQEEGEHVAAEFQRPSAVTTGLEVFDCPVCFEPLGPPIFQCAVRHLICSACRDKLKGNKCLLSPTTRRRATPRACVHARCFCTEPGCNFVGPVVALLAHLTAAITGGHKLPSKAFRFYEPFDLRASPGMHVLHSEDEGHVFLLSVTPSPPLGHAVSLVSVQPDGAAEPGPGRCPAALEAVVYSKFGCSVVFSCFPGHHQIATLDRVRCSSLAHGPPADFFCVVPMVPEEGDDGVTLRFTIDTELSYDYVELMEEDDDDDSYYDDDEAKV